MPLSVDDCRFARLREPFDGDSIRQTVTAGHSNQHPMPVCLYLQGGERPGQRVR
jgi:hypothetical protein